MVIPWILLLGNAATGLAFLESGVARFRVQSQGMCTYGIGEVESMAHVRQVALLSLRCNRDATSFFGICMYVYNHVPCSKYRVNLESGIQCGSVWSPIAECIVLSLGMCV